MSERAGQPPSVEAMLAAAQAKLRKNTSQQPGTSTVLDSELTINPDWYRRTPVKRAAQHAPKKTPKPAAETPITPERPVSALSLVPRPGTEQSQQILEELARAETVVERARREGHRPQLLIGDYSQQAVAFMRSQGYGAYLVAEFTDIPMTARTPGRTEHPESLTHSQPPFWQRLLDRQISKPELSRTPKRRLAITALAAAVVTYPASFWLGHVVRHDDSWLSIAPRAAATGADAFIKTIPVVRDVASLAEAPLKTYFGGDETVTESDEPEVEP